MSELKCDTCNVKPGTTPCHSCPYEQALIARLKEEVEIAKKMLDEEEKNKHEKEL